MPSKAVILPLINHYFWLFLWLAVNVCLPVEGQIFFKHDYTFFHTVLIESNFTWNRESSNKSPRYRNGKTGKSVNINVVSKK